MVFFSTSSVQLILHIQWIFNFEKLYSIVGNKRGKNQRLTVCFSARPEKESQLEDDPGIKGIKGTIRVLSLVFNSHLSHILIRAVKVSSSKLSENWSNIPGSCFCAVYSNIYDICHDIYTQSGVEFKQILDCHTWSRCTFNLVAFFNRA